MDLWTQLLDLLSQVVTPIWSSLLQYLPLLMFGLIALVLLAVARSWTHNLALNRSRVPLPVTSGPLPEGVHLPGPSIWPFFLPIAGLFILFSLAIKPQNLPVN